jgi:beta-glucosidase
LETFPLNKGNLPMGYRGVNRDGRAIAHKSNGKRDAKHNFTFRGQNAIVGAIFLAGSLLADPAALAQAAQGAAIAASQQHVGPQAQTSAVIAAPWPKLRPAYPADPALEARIARIIAGMTLAQKVGQMTQPEIKSITPEEVRRFYIGSVLNGGGSWPQKNKHASAADWLALAEQYREASMSTDMPVQIPVIWGTDAVHGHGNVMGATLFPHNIALGAAHDAALVGEIGASVARAVRATGIDWAFAPTLAVARDDRWGRTYESFSEDPALVREYARSFVLGMQGRPGASAGSPDSLQSRAHIVATAKHFLADGGTDLGRNEGVYRGGVDELVARHGAGYYGAIEAGVLAVMASFNSWNDAAAGVEHGKMHGSGELLTGVLKGRLAFDGLVVSDWNGIAQVPGCADAGCPAAINAGIDLVMVPDQWRAFIANTVAQVERGEIPMARIDDAVARILRVKLRAGLFEHRPKDGLDAGKNPALQDRALARRAVRESLVLLKNEGKAPAAPAPLPIAPGRRVLLVGKGADSFANQSGGWSLTWQGTENENADYPVGDTLLAALRDAIGASKVQFRVSAEAIEPDFDWNSVDTVVAVVGETPYAESRGDIPPTSSLHHASRYPEDLAMLQAVAGHGKPVVTVFLSGRPLYVNDLLNLSDAFVAAWLPGTEGGGVTDLIVGDRAGRPRHQFRGTLSFSWPRGACQSPLNFDEPGANPLFPIRFGLRYGDGHPRLGALPVEVPAHGCAAGRASQAVFQQVAAAPFALWAMAGESRAPVPADLNASFALPAAPATPAIRVETIQVHTQQDGRRIFWSGPARWSAQAAAPQDFSPWVRQEGALRFDIRVLAAPRGSVRVGLGCGAGCAGAVDLGWYFRELAPNTVQAMNLPLACLVRRGLDPARVTEAFAIESDGAFTADIADVRIEAESAKDAGAFPCP